MKPPSHSARRSAHHVIRIGRFALVSLLGCMLVVTSVQADAQADTGAASASGLEPRFTERSNLMRMTSGYYTRSREYRLLHQDISVWDFNWEARSFAGRVTTTVTSLQAPLQVVRLDAGNQLTITRVINKRGQPLKFDHRKDTLLVYLTKPLPYRDTTRFTVEYTGKNADGLYFVETAGRRPRHLWSVGSKTTNHSWFPTCDLQNNKTTWDLTITALKEYTIISNGRKISDVPAPHKQHTAHWRMEHPASTYLISMVIAPVVTIKDRWHNIPLEYHVYRPDSAIAKQVFSMTGRAMDVYSKLTGVPYPWPRYAQITVGDFPWSGMENLTATILTDALPQQWDPGSRPFYVYDLVPHELAHQWFGNFVTHGNWSNSWLSEGFANFMTGHFWNAEFGPEGGEEYFFRQYWDWMSADRRDPIGLAGPSENVVYAKGSAVLEMLRKQLGDTLFWASVHEFLTRYAYGNADSDEFRQTLFSVTGQNLDWFFNDWVYGAGHPDFIVTSAYDSTAHRLTLTVKQTQTPVRTLYEFDEDTTFYETPAAFRTPVVIRVGVGGREIVHRGWIGTRQQMITIDSVMSAPTMVVFDDDNAIAKTLRFDMPTAWLIAMLERDTNLWNNWWAVEQLMSRLDEPSAIAALKSAATRSKYQHTRAHATDAAKKDN